MLPLTLNRADGPLTVLCLGAHADDIEIGAGGTILQLLERHPEARVLWVVLSATPIRALEAHAAAGAFLAKASAPEVIVEDFRDGFFPTEFSRLKELFEGIKARFQPSVVFTHHRIDAHQDHRTVAELTWNTFRDHLILEYEIPKYDPDIGNPNLFVPLTAAQAAAKVDALMTHFSTQRARRWFAPGTFEALLRLRGLQAAAPSGLAEAFHAPKFHVGF
jgi:LmbE family N-acetylglucosaminyl deacetylase